MNNLKLLLPTQKIQRAENLSYEVACIIAAEAPGEQWHPDYKKDKEGFRRIIRQEIRFERAMYRYFREQANNVDNLVNWNYYHRKLTAADGPIDTQEWEGELVKLKVLFYDNIEEFFDIGMNAAATEIGTPLPFDVKDMPAQRAIQKHGLEQAKRINKTTKNRIRAALKRSLSTGENQTEAANRVQKVIQDRYRAEMIAHTESVQAFSLGKLEAGKGMGIEYKEWWDGQAGACPVCSDELDRRTIPIDEQFISSFGTHPGPPAHPWCRCLLKLRRQAS